MLLLSLNPKLEPRNSLRFLSASAEAQPFGASATRAEREDHLRSLPATLPLLERVRLQWQLLSSVYGAKPQLTRMLLVNAEDEAQRSRLPLQAQSHPFFIAPLSETPLLLGLSLLGVLSGTVNYLHHGFMGLAAEPFLLVFLLATLRWCGYLERLGANPAVYSSAVRRNLLVGILLFIVSEVMIFFALF